jgi:hypothetical protein
VAGAPALPALLLGRDRRRRRSDPLVQLALRETSHPFAFFDYFRVPYGLQPPRQPKAPVGAAAFVRTLAAVAPPSQDSRSLMWIGADARPAARSAAGQLGCYRLDNFTFFGHVAADAAVLAMLPQPGRGWHPAEPIRDAEGRQVAAIWRDTDGNVFLPFEPGEVMQLYWSEGYRDIGRSGIAALGRTAALRGYYLARPACPGRFSLRCGVCSPGCRRLPRSRDGRSRTACTTSTTGCSRSSPSWQPGRCPSWACGRTAGRGLWC